MVKKRIFIGMSSILITSSILGTVVLGEPIKPTNSKSTQGTNAVTQPTALRIDNKVISMTGTVVSRPTNDGIAYMLNTSEGTFALIGPSAKSLSSFANIDKKITVSGNPVIGQKIIVIQTFKEYVPEVKLSLSEDKNLKPTVSSDKNTTTQPTALRVDNKLISITGSITSRPTNDGIAYILNASEGTFALIGPSAKSLSSFANIDKKITVSGNPVVGQKIIVIQTFKEYIPEVKPSLSEDKNLKSTVSPDKSTTTQPTALRVDNKLVSITGSITSKPTNDGIAYILNTSEGTFALIGPNAKSLSSFANSDKKITVSGNLVVGQKIIVVQNFNR